MSSIVELEILRAKCYYNFYNTILDVFKDKFNMDLLSNRGTSPIWRDNGYVEQIRKYIAEWMYVLVMIKGMDDNPSNNNDSLFIYKFNDNLKNELRQQMFTGFRVYLSKYVSEMNELVKLSISIYDIMMYSFEEYNKILKTTKINKDNKINVRKNLADQYVLEYKSDSLKNVTNDNNVKIENDTITMVFHSDPMYIESKDYNINVVFADYFRYKYMYADNQLLAYNYDVTKDGIECFSTPFNRKHNFFCSAFPDLEKQLGSQGEFFNLMKKAIKGEYTFPTNNLKINPVFVEIIDLNMSELIIELLHKKIKYQIEIVLPDWKNFKAKDILLKSKYLKTFEVFNKGKIIFKNNFSGRMVAPADIIIIKMSNL